MNARENAVEVISNRIWMSSGNGGAVMEGKKVAAEILGAIIQAVKEEQDPKILEIKKLILGQKLERAEAKDVIPFQGYTSEQWQGLKDGEYLCEFSNNSDFDYDYGVSCGVIDKTKTRNGSLLSKRIGGGQYWNYCRPAQIKNVMRPIFVEPVDKDAKCIFLSEEDSQIYKGEWRLMVNMRKCSTIYIEL